MKIFPGTDRTFGRAKRGRLHRSGQKLRQHIATGSVVYNDACAHQETNQRQPRPALSQSQVRARRNRVRSVSGKPYFHLGHVFIERQMFRGKLTCYCFV